MDNICVFEELYGIIRDRQENFEEGSYTCYLFSQGIDKILKKCGEESAEMIIAAKNNDNNGLKGEICDLLYHVLVLCADRGLNFLEVEAELKERTRKIGNLKHTKETDKCS
jgi:phosphoribosyl-ATP pyrophosphohydrolase